MTQEEIVEIEGTIGYCFSNKTLLQQAFTRRSYSEENGGQNNEVLEFIGDKVLDYTITKNMSAWYGHINKNNEFESRLNEANLTEIRKKLVCKAMLSERCDILGLNQYLIMGNGDCKNHAENDTSVKEDTFEALLGAVAMDSKYNQDIINKVVYEMLDPEPYLNKGFDTNENSVSRIQEWFQRKGYGLPAYKFSNNLMDASGWSIVCSLLVPGVNLVFSGTGNSKTKARMSVSDQALDYLIKNSLLTNPNDIVKDPTENNAISQLNQLFQHGIISEPKYLFKERRDEKGNIIWDIEVHVKELADFWKGSYSSKKDGKRELAYKTLLEILKK